MTNALFGFNNRALTGTLTASAAAAGLGPDQLANPHGATSSSWQTPAGTTTAHVRLDAGSAVEWGAVALCNTNLTPAATVRWRLSNDANFAASMVWDTGAVPVVVAGYRQAVAVEPAALQASGSPNAFASPRLPWEGMGTRAGVTRGTGAMAPIGGVTTDRIIENTATSDHYIEGTTTIPSNQINTFSVFLRPAGRTVIILRLYDSTTYSSFIGCTATLTGAGSVGSNAQAGTGTFVSSSISDAGGGWYRVSVTGTVSTSANNVRPRIQLVNASTTYTGDGVSGVDVWGLQIVAGGLAATQSLPSAVARYLRVDIADPGNPAGFIRAAQLYAGPVARPIGNIGYETAFARTVDAPALTTRGGQEFPILRHTRRGWRIALPSLREAEVWPMVDALQLAAADGRNVLFIPFPAGADIQRDAVFGRLTEPAPITWPNPTPLRRAWSCTITERL